MWLCGGCADLGRWNADAGPDETLRPPDVGGGGGGGAAGPAAARHGPARPARRRRRPALGPRPQPAAQPVLAAALSVPAGHGRVGGPGRRPGQQELGLGRRILLVLVLPARTALFQTRYVLFFWFAHSSLFVLFLFTGAPNSEKTTKI